jgi:hypothetical protein
MRLPSRYLFPLKPAAPGAGVVAFVVLFALLDGVLYGAYRLVRDFLSTGNPFIFAVALFVVLLSVSGIVDSRKRRARLWHWRRRVRAKALQFARAFPRRDVDAWVIRAVWETVMAWGGRDLARLNFPCGRTTAGIFALDDEKSFSMCSLMRRQGPGVHWKILTTTVFSSYAARYGHGLECAAHDARAATKKRHRSGLG